MIGHTTGVLSKLKEGAGRFGIKVPEEGSYWFKRLYVDTKKISPHIRFRRIKNGFYRLYWRHAYLHEVFKEMPLIGYTKEDPHLATEQLKIYEEFEDHDELPRKIKNYVE